MKHLNLHHPPPQTVNSSPPQTVNSSQPSGSEGSLDPSPPQTINSSSSSGVEEVIPLIQISSGSSSRHTQTTIPQPTSPQSTPASSAKTTPRKKSK